MLSVFVDILLGVTFFGILFVHYHRGFARSVLIFARVAISTLITFLFGPIVAEWLASQQSGALAIPMYLVSYALLFALAFVGMTLLTWQVGKLVKLPVLKQCDKILGLVLGTITGLVAISVMACMLYLILRLVGASEVYENSIVFKIWLHLPSLQSIVEAIG